MIMLGKITPPPPVDAPLAQYSLRKFIRIVFGAGKFVVGKGYAGADKNDILNTQSIPKLHATFNGNVIAYYDIVFN
jgi:hypothetical protein